MMQALTTIDPTTPPERTTHFISLGAGVQSTVLYLMACRGLIRPAPYVNGDGGLIQPPVFAAVFADTGWEPQAVYDHLDWLESLRLSIPIVRVSAGDLYADTWDATPYGRVGYTDIPTYVYNPGGKLGIRKRQCTNQYKIRPIHAWVSKMIGRKPRARTPYACQWLGITSDEWHRAKPSRASWVSTAHPFLDLGWRRHDCLDWFAQQYPKRPLVKSACMGCPFHADRTWLQMARQDPEGMERTIQLDDRLQAPERIALENGRGLPQYLHNSGRPLREVLADLDRRDKMKIPLFDTDGFGNECEGHCGV